MAADLHIHIRTDAVTDEVMAIFRSPTIIGGPRDNIEAHERAYTIVAETPDIWVGEVSWLKAALLDDAETYVPDPVSQVSEIIGHDYPIIDDALIERVRVALGAKNTTGYSIADAEPVVAFLREHRGQRAFQVSW